MKLKNLFSVWLCCIAVLFSADSNAEISIDKELDIRILYDNSGSMYPGYRLEEEGTHKKTRLGVDFYHEYPEFREWLAALISSQGQLNGKDISITAFTDRQLNQILPPAPIEEVNHDTIINAFSKLVRYGMITELTQNLENFIRGFEGIVWLITDNIIDTKSGSHDYEDIVNFFRILRDKGEYKSVHLYKYPFRDESKNQDSNLAIYGILLSPEEIDDSVLEYFDDKFFQLEYLFPGNEHLKLKDLSVNPLIFEGKIDAELLKSEKNTFIQSQKVRFHLQGRIRSNLTQHTVTGGEYRIGIQGPFYPADPKAEKEYGVVPIPSDVFNETTDSISEPIQPNGVRELEEKIICSETPINISVQPGIVSYIKSAFGINIKYEGQARFSLYNITLHFERSYLAGIYGIDQTSSVFNFQDITNLSARPRTVKLDFTLDTGNAKGFVLLFVLLVLLALFGFLIWFFFLQKEQCRIKTDLKTDTISFRRLGSYHIVYDGKLIGTVARGFGKNFVFAQSRPTATLRINPLGTEGGKYNITLRDKNFMLTIEPLGSGRVTTAGAAPGPPGAGTSPVRDSSKVLPVPGGKKFEPPKSAPGPPGAGTSPVRDSSKVPPVPGGKKFEPPKPKL